MLAKYCAPSLHSAVYLLSTHAHVAVTGKYLVILDAATGKYLGLTVGQARSLSPWVEDWPLRVPAEGKEGGAPPQLLGHLLDRGLLTSDRNHGKSAAPVSITMRDQWHGDQWRKRPPIRAHHVWHFSRALLYACFALRRHSFSGVAGRVAARRMLNQPYDSGDIERAVYYMMIFRRMQPFVYARDGRCLFHCFALLEFLASYRVYPVWMVGVRTNPFQAHSWLTYDGATLTDPPLTVDRFTPIMLI